jgi:phosphopantothenoylcysteine decarboxylase/phosphopantothenate--cysteine ligase
MAEPEEIFELIVNELKGSGPLRDKKVLVTAGPCREAIDPVRFISNRSSGKMGFALARQAERLGAEVTLVSGPVALDDPPGIEVVRVENTEQMAEAVEAAFKDADYLIMAAAPADYKTAENRPQKIKKGDQELNIKLVPTIDILRNIASIRTNSQTIVGFSLETENDLENGKKKLQEKRLDYIVINNPLEEGAGFDTDTNRVTIVSKSGDVRVIDRDDKDVIAEKIWEYIIADGIR